MEMSDTIPKPDHNEDEATGGDEDVVSAGAEEANRAGLVNTLTRLASEDAQMLDEGKKLAAKKAEFDAKRAKLEASKDEIKKQMEKIESNFQILDKEQSQLAVEEEKFQSESAKFTQECEASKVRSDGLDKLPPKLVATENDLSAREAKLSQQRMKLSRDRRDLERQRTNAKNDQKKFDTVYKEFEKLEAEFNEEFKMHDEKKRKVLNEKRRISQIIVSDSGNEKRLEELRKKVDQYEQCATSAERQLRLMRGAGRFQKAHYLHKVKILEETNAKLRSEVSKLRLDCIARYLWLLSSRSKHKQALSVVTDVIKIIVGGKPVIVLQSIIDLLLSKKGIDDSVMAELETYKSNFDTSHAQILDIIRNTIESLEKSCELDGESASAGNSSPLSRFLSRERKFQKEYLVNYVTFLSLWPKVVESIISWYKTRRADNEENQERELPSPTVKLTTEFTFYQEKLQRTLSSAEDLDAEYEEQRQVVADLKSEVSRLKSDLADLIRAKIGSEAQAQLDAVKGELGEKKAQLVEAERNLQRIRESFSECIGRSDVSLNQLDRQTSEASDVDETQVYDVADKLININYIVSAYIADRTISVSSSDFFNKSNSFESDA